MRSSYALNNYAEVFRTIVEASRAKMIVELGVLDGYSTMAMAEGLRNAGEGGIIQAYDLFEDYPYNHSRFAEVRKTFELESFVQIYKQDAFDVYRTIPINSVSLLHVDLSNTGDTLRTIMEQWDTRMVYGGLILFEGGTVERDNIEWMVKYNKPSIKAEMENNPIIREKYIFGTYLKFPGLSVLLKKR